MIGSSLAKWVGIPYADKGRGPDAYDCWGLVRAILAAELDLQLPDYADDYVKSVDQASVAAAIEAGLADGWHRVAHPEPFDLLVLRLAGRPWHCGLIVAPNRFLHMAPQRTSCVERLDSLLWAKRIEGVYRHG